jgi:hypothetical protein
MGSRGSLSLLKFLRDLRNNEVESRAESEVNKSSIVLKKSNRDRVVIGDFKSKGSGVSEVNRSEDLGIELIILEFVGGVSTNSNALLHGSIESKGGSLLIRSGFSFDFSFSIDDLLSDTIGGDFEGGSQVLVLETSEELVVEESLGADLEAGVGASVDLDALLDLVTEQSPGGDHIGAGALEHVQVLNSYGENLVVLVVNSDVELGREISLALRLAQLGVGVERDVDLVLGPQFEVSVQGDAVGLVGEDVAAPGGNGSGQRVVVVGAKAFLGSEFGLAGEFLFWKKVNFMRGNFTNALLKRANLAFTIRSSVSR